MECIAISFIRNESEVIESFVRYHLKIVDKMYLANHRSIDNTEEILVNLKNEGLPIEIFQVNSHRYCQGEVTTKLLKKAAQEADWIVPLDADEFITPNTIFRDTLKSLSKDCTHFIRWKNYFPSEQEDPQEINILKKFQFRSNIIDPNQHKVIVPSDLVKKYNVNFPQGNHEVYHDGEDLNTKRFKRGKVLPYEIIKDLYLAHFPIRSLKQLKSKIYAGWLSQVANHNETPGKLTEDKELPSWYHWKKIYNKFKENEKVTLDEFFSLYIRHFDELIHDPLEIDFDIKYEIKPAEPTSILAQTAEEIAIGLQEANQIIFSNENLIKKMPSENLVF